jgi:hypothetical protein
VGEPARFEDMMDALQHLRHVMVVIVLQVVRAIDGIVLIGAQLGFHLTGIAYHVGVPRWVDVQENLLVSVVEERKRNIFAATPDVENRLTFWI